MKRKCLKCQKEFESEGKGNRICQKCQLANRNLTVRTASQAKAKDGKVVRKKIGEI